jgi:hypothetical protein
VNGIGCDLYHLIARCDISEDFELAVERLSSLDCHPFRLVVANSNNKGVLLIGGYG